VSEASSSARFRRRRGREREVRNRDSGASRWPRYGGPGDLWSVQARRAGRRHFAKSVAAAARRWRFETEGSAMPEYRMAGEFFGEGMRW